MRKQDYLSALIASLDSNEKRHFRLFAGYQPGEKNYLKLYDELEKETKPDNATLCKKLDLTPAQLAGLKHYLLQVLLKSIRIYKDGATIDSSLSNSLTEANELDTRGLSDYAMEVLDKALEKTKEVDAQYYAPVLLKEKLAILHRMARYDEVKNTYQQYLLSQAINDERMELSMLVSAVTAFEQSRKSPEEFDMRNHRLFHTKPHELKSRRGQMGWFTLMTIYYVAMKKNSEQMLDLVRTESEFYESSPELRESNPYQYTVAQIRLMTSEGHSDHLDAALTASGKILKLLPTLSQKLDKPTIESMTAFTIWTQALIYFRMGKYEEGLKLSKKADSLKDKMVDYVRYTHVVNYACALMFTGHCAEAIDKFDELLQINTELRMDIQPYVRPLMILAQLDMGHYQVVPYLVKSARQWMKRRKLSDSGVELLLSHTYAIAKAPSSEHKTKWAELLRASESDSLDNMDKEIHIRRWLATRKT